MLSIHPYTASDPPNNLSMSQSISFRQATPVVLLLAAVQFILQMSLLARGMEYIATSLIIDDTYYYLQNA